MAAPILAFENMGLNLGTHWLFRHLDLAVGERDRLALIGRNGAGKSTLFRLIAGTTEPDEGRRIIVPGTRIVLLDQDPAVSGFATLKDFALAGPDTPPAHAVAAIADQIGIDLSREAASASGGERRRAAIARALAQDPDLLLLDEPTNHLDLAAIEWLESWLGRYSGAFIAISHDRTFLTRLTRSTIWLDRGQLRRAEIGFGGFDAWTEQVYAEEARAAEKLDAKLKLELHWLQRGVTARRKRNQGRLEKLNVMRAQRAAMLGPQGTAKLALASDDSKSKTVIAADQVNLNFGDRRIIRDFTLRIQRGDRIGIVGANGTGKTSLLRVLTGELAPSSGTVTLAPTLSGVIIDQQRRLLAPERTVREVLAEGSDWIDVRGVRKHIQGYLKEFLFDPGLSEVKVGTLSGGERSRLLLAREFARASNLLVLDEPTNDLDLETLDLLQEVIADYYGTVMIVSHDRDFLDRTVNLTLGLDGSGRIDIIAGGYADWERKRSAPVATTAKKPVSGGETVSRPVPPRAAKLSYRDQRDYDQLPARVEQLGEDIAATEMQLHDPDLYTRDRAAFDRLQERLAILRAEMEAAETRWLALAEQVEALAASV